jgi:hypothetical protein
VIGFVRPTLKAEGNLWQPPNYVPKPPSSPGESYSPDEPYLPLVQLDDYEWRNDPNIVRTEMESGVIRQRRYSVSRIRTVEATIHVNCRQLANFEQLLQSVKSSWFRWPVLTGQSNGLVKEHIARIIDVVGISVIGNDLYEVSFDMEVYFK